MTTSSPSKFYLRSLAGFAIGYGVIWLLLAIDPVSRKDWALENIVVVAGLLVLVLSWRWYRFSLLSYGLIALFLCFHAVGSHYTYSLVPYDETVTRWTGRSLNAAFGWERNHYDRLVHFLYGLLLLVPYRETFLHFARVRWGFWSYLVPLSFVLSSSLVYELLEWAAAVVLGGDEGLEFVGSQGDIWDAQIDSFAAMVGGILATFLMVAFSLLRGRDPSREWVKSQSPAEGSRKR